MSSAVRVVEDWGSFLGEIQKKNSDRWGSRFDSPVYLGKLETAGGKTFIVRIEIGGGAYTSYYTSKKEWAVSFDVALYRAGTFWSQPQFVNHLTVNLGSNIAAPPPAGWHNYDSPAMQAMLAAKDLRELRVYAGKNDEKQTDRATVAFEFNGVARKLTVMLVDSNEDVLMDLE